MRPGASVRAEDLITLAKAALQADLQGIVAIIASILEEVVTVHRSIQRVVSKTMHSAFFEELYFQKDGRWQLLLEANAPVEVSWRCQIVPVHRERGRHGYWHAGRFPVRICRISARIEKVIDPLPIEGLVDQSQVGCVIDNSNSRRELGIAFIVENVSSGEARREQRSPHDFIPIQA